MDLTKDIEVLTKLTDERSPLVARILALALKQAFQNDDQAELVRVASVVKELASPLISEFEPLLFYARAVTKWARGDLNGAIFEFRSLRHSGHRFKPGCYRVSTVLRGLNKTWTL